MTAHNIPSNALIVVADGTRARLYRNRANGGGILKLEKTSVLEPRDLDDEGPAGSRPPESSKEEADPETLGQMRPSLHKVVTDRLVQEVAKTLTNSPVSEIERLLTS